MKIVVKLGTSVLTGGSRRLDRPHMVDIARQIRAIREAGHQVVVVSSGAIVAGREKIADRRHPIAGDPQQGILETRSGEKNVGYPTKKVTSVVETLVDKQVLAAVGQVHLMAVWQAMFNIHQIEVGQMLLTRADLDHRERFLNARDTLEGLLAAGIVPIINENDAVATAEIKVGDNDNLSACVAVLDAADLLILLTDQEGLMTANPSLDPSATLISEVVAIDQTLKSMAGGSVSGLGTGGMVTKLQAAEIARCSGVNVVIASFKQPNCLLRLSQGQAVGTKIPANSSRLESRKRWILAGPTSQGMIHLDSGAVTAVLTGNRSLLAKGILKVTGPFNRGDVILLVDSNGKGLARGLSRYASNDLEKIQGIHSDQIQDRIGFNLGDAVVHRDELVLL